MMERADIPNTRARQALPPLGWKGSLGIFALLASGLYLAHYRLVPSYTAATGKPYLVGFLWAWVTTVGMVFTASLVLYGIEGRARAWRPFAARYWLDHMPRRDWLWALAVLLVTTGSMFGLSSTSEWLAKVSLFAPHPMFPPELQPGGFAKLTPGIFMGMALKNQWWIPGIYLVGWLLNVLGEEFFYRGWMLPRQVAAFGRWAWVVNGTMFCFQHFMQPWNFLAIWPGALFMAYVVQRRRNCWIGVIQHGVMNFATFVFVVAGVAG